MKQRRIVLLAATFVVACSDRVPVAGPAFELEASSPSQLLQSFACVDLLAGRSMPIGKVCTVNDAVELRVQYRAAAGWTLVETHLAVASDLPGLPRTRLGNPVIGHFGRKTTHHPPVTTFTYSISLEESAFKPGDEIVVAAHADVVDQSGRREAAWGAGARFTERGSWATYFGHRLDTHAELVRFVGAEGGVLEGVEGSLIQGVRLVVPQGAFGQDEVVAIGVGSSVEFQQVLAESPLRSVLVGPVVLIETSAHVLSRPAILTLPYVESLIPADNSIGDVHVTTVDESGRPLVIGGLMPIGAVDGLIQYLDGEDLEAPRIQVDDNFSTVTVGITEFSPKANSVSPNWTRRAHQCASGICTFTQDKPSDLGARSGEPESIVIHSTDSWAGQGISGVIDYALSNGKCHRGAADVGTHYYVDRAGATFSLVSDDRIACHEKEPSINDPSIGIELVQNVQVNEEPGGGFRTVIANPEAFTDVQLDALERLMCGLIKRYDLQRQDVIFHAGIDEAFSRGKRDPRGLDASFIEAVFEGCERSTTIFGTFRGTITETQSSGGSLSFPVSIEVGSGGIVQGQQAVRVSIRDERIPGNNPVRYSFGGLVPSASIGGSFGILFQLSPSGATCTGTASVSVSSVSGTFRCVFTRFGLHMNVSFLGDR